MKVYKFRSIDNKKILKRDLDSFQENKFYAPNFKNLNDKFEANFDEIISDSVNLLGNTFNTDTSDIKKSINEVISYKEKLGVFCLSKNCFSEPLWAYYASDSKGYCIEYDLEKLKGITKNRDFSIELVLNYYDEKPIITVHDIMSKNLIPKMFASKKKCWEHEEEIRIIFDSAGLKEHHESAITGIYFGSDASEKLIEKIKSKFIDREITFYKITVNSQKNKLEKELINKNTKKFKYNIDNFNFKLVKTVDSTAMSYYLHIEENYNINELQNLAMAFQERNYYKPSNIYFINNLEVLEVIEKYPKNNHEYLKYAESVVADFQNGSLEVFEYPFKDSRYIELINQQGKV